MLIAALALGLAWVFGAVALHAPGAAELRRDVQRSRDPRRAQRRAAPLGPDPQRAQPRRSAAEHHGPSAPVGPPTEAIVDDPDVRAAGAERGQGARDRLRAGGRGIGLDGLPGAGGHQRPRGRRGAGHHGGDPGRGPGRRGAGALRPGQRPRGAAGRLGLPLLPLAAQTRSRAPTRRCSAIRRTAGSTIAAGPLRRDPGGDQRGLLRARADAAPDELAARHDPQRQLGRAGGRRARAGCWRRCSPPRPAARRAATGCPNEIVGEALRALQGRGEVGTGPCAVG